MTQGLGHVTVNAHLVEPLARLVDVPIKVTVVLAVALMLNGVVRRAEARARHALLSAALLGALVMPIISHVTPNWRWELWSGPPSWLTTQGDKQSVPSGISAPHTAKQSPVDSTSSSNIPPHHRHADPASPVLATTRPRFPWSVLILSLWVAGTMVILARLALHLARVTRLARDGTLLRSDRWRAAAAQLISEGRMSQRIRLLEHHKINVPFTYGLFSPTILLPADPGSWSIERRRHVLMHELSHIQRNDWLIRMIAQFTCALHWFNPLIWIAARCLHAAQEQACDERVVLLGTRPSEYAAHLLDIARSISPGRTLPVATWATTCPSILEMRVRSVLRLERSRRRSVALLPIAPIGMVFVVVLVASLVPTGSRAYKQALPVVAGVKIKSLPDRSVALPTTAMDSGGRPVLGNESISIIASKDKSREALARRRPATLNPLPSRIVDRVRQRTDDRAHRRAADRARRRAEDRAHQRAEDRAHQRAEDRALQRAEDRARQRAEKRASRRMDELIARTISKSIEMSIHESIAASIAPCLSIDLSGGTP